MTKKEARIAHKKEVRKKFASLTEDQKKKLADNAIIARVDGGALSVSNTIMLYLQTYGTGTTPTVVGGYDQWRKAGRQVSQGQHGLLIWYPVGKKNENGEIEEVDKFFMGSVFDVTQTEERAAKSA